MGGSPDLEVVDEALRAEGISTHSNFFGSIPSFIHISDGIYLFVSRIGEAETETMHDVRVLDILPIEAGAFFVTRLSVASIPSDRANA